MKTVDEFLTHLTSLGIKVWAEGESLRYRAPAGVLTPALKHALSERKAEILAMLRGSRRPARILASFAQQRMWVLHKLDPASAAYNFPEGLRFHGTLSVDALSSAIREIVVRHEALRTTFSEELGQVFQDVREPYPVNLIPIDLRSLSPSDQESEFRRLEEEDAARPFDLASGPLFRAFLLQLRDDGHVLLLTLHHIVADGWSVGVLVRELASLYTAFVRGTDTDVPQLPAQYADFALRQRAWAQGDVPGRQLAYWRTKLAGSGEMQLPIDRPRAPRRRYRGAAVRFELSRELTLGLRSLSRANNATLFMTLLAAFQCLLSRYTGQEDVLVGTAVANRDGLEFEPLIGLFVNTLVLRTSLAGDPSFVDALKRVRETATEAYAHQELPFEQLVEEVVTHRDLSRTPLFQAYFALLNEATAEFELPGLRVRSFPRRTASAKFELSLQMAPVADRLTGEIEYDSDLFAESTIGRLSANFQQLLESAVEFPTRRLSELDWISSREKREIAGWNDTTSDYPRDVCLQSLFEARAALAPDSTALVFGETSLSYAQLNVRANRLARALRDRGIRIEDRVGVCAESAVEMVVGFLATLKAGGAYVPLDSSYPIERLKFMLSDSGAKVLLCGSGIPAGIAPAGICQMPLSEEAWAGSPLPTENPQVACDPLNLAYVMYTSGSTGTPRGIGIPHRGIVRLVRNTNYVELGAEETIVQTSSTSFDVSTLEIWGALLNGGRLVGIDNDTKLSPARFAEALERHHVTTVCITPALFNQVVESRPGAFRHVRNVMVAGEALDPFWVRKLLSGQPPRRLLNAYGPTESTTYASWYLIDELSPDVVNVPIGRGVSNTTLYILDRALVGVPVGAAGELYLGGEGLARCYHGRPALTAASFVPDPFGGSGARMYRTGDLARWRTDGQVEFLGRVDRQVKLRGFRIELGEIENVLEAHPSARHSITLLRADARGEKRLVAYIVPAQGRPLDGEELRRHLRQRLPDYMVPSAFIAMAQFPLNPNGKLDHSAFPDPPAQESACDFRAPGTALQKEVAGVWRELLGVEEAGLDDDFFEAGGHSLLAARLAARLSDQYGVDMGLRTVFENPRLGSLVAALQELLDQKQTTGLEALLSEIEGLSNQEVLCALGGSAGL